MQQVIQIIVNPHDLQNMLDLACEKAYQRGLTDAGGKPEIISREELLQRLGISEPTRIKLEKRGKIKSLNLGGSTKYDWTEVIKSLKK